MAVWLDRLAQLAYGQYWVLAYVYPLMILAALAIGEFVSLKAVAIGHAGEKDLQGTAGALAGVLPP